MEVVLASQSPRRRALLEQIGFLKFAVRPALGEERVDSALSPSQLVEALSRQKALEVRDAASDGTLIIAADTVVALDAAVLGKPGSPLDAARMLRLLSDREHTVYTGLTVCRGCNIITEHEGTKVRFRPLTEDEIARYIATGEPMDKAGAYGIQGYGGLFVSSICGDYFNVVGLPICRLGRILTRFGVDVSDQWTKEDKLQ